MSRQSILLSKEPSLNEALGKHSSKHQKKRSRKHRSSRKSKSRSTSANRTPQTSTSIKLPYPVLNDKRDMNVIFEILKEKHQNLSAMYEKTCASLQNQIDDKEAEAKRAKIKNLQENIKLQLSRLNRQIEYVKLNIEIQKLSKCFDLEQDKEVKDKLRRKLSDLSKQNENLLSMMKEANRKFLKQHQEQQIKPVPAQTEVKPEIIKPEPAPVVTSSCTAASALPITYYRSIPPPAMPNNKPPSASMTPPTSSASSSSSSSSITNQRSQIQTQTAPVSTPAAAMPRYNRAQVRTPPLPTPPNQFHPNRQQRARTPPQQTHNNPNLQMQNFANMFNNPAFLNQMMSMFNNMNNNNNNNNQQKESALLPSPPNMLPAYNNMFNPNIFSNSALTKTFFEYFTTFAQSLNQGSLGGLNANQLQAMFANMQRNFNFNPNPNTPTSMGYNDFNQFNNNNNNMNRFNNINNNSNLDSNYKNFRNNNNNTNFNNNNNPNNKRKRF